MAIRSPSLYSQAVAVVLLLNEVNWLKERQDHQVYVQAMVVLYNTAAIVYKHVIIGHLQKISHLISRTAAGSHGAL